jgi:hypothetical protein
MRIILAIILIISNTNGISGEYSLCRSASMISGGGTEEANHHSQAAGAKTANHR